MKDILQCAVLFILLFASSISTKAQRVLNGSFENHTFTTTATNLSNANFNSNVSSITSYSHVNPELDILMTGNFYGPAARTGNTCLAYTNNDSFTMSLNAPLVSGRQYMISFWVSRPNSSPGTIGMSIGASTSATSWGTNIYTTASPANGVNVWERRHTIFTAPNNATHISFASAVGWTMIDDVEVSPIYTKDVPAMVCPCNTINVSYDVLTGATLASTNDFDIQLSNASGSFVAPTLLGTVSNSNTSGTVSVQIPCSTAYGTKYRIRIESNNSSYISTESNEFTIVAPVVLATTNDTVCVNNPALLVATKNAGRVEWYDSATGGNRIHIGDNLAIPSATINDTFYAQASMVVDSNLNSIVPTTNNNRGIFFNTVTKKDITLTDISWIPQRSDTNYKVNVYLKAGTHVGSESNSAAWTLIGSVVNYSSTSGVEHKLTLNAPVNLAAGQTYGIYIVDTTNSTNYIYYHTANTPGAGNIWVENDDLQLIVGGGTGGIFTGIGNTDRAFDGILWYETTGCVSARVPVTVSIDSPVNITTHPVTTRTLCAGQNTTFSVTATGTNLNYQWQAYNGTTWSNATGGVYSNGNTDTLTITAATATLDGYLYRCIVRNAGCTPDTSNTGSLTVEAAPVITTHPVTHGICTGSNTTFTVAATGSNLSYQWQVNNGTSWTNATGGIYSGGNTNTLTLTNATTTVDNYKYRCTVFTTICSSPVSSDSATLSVVPLPTITSTQNDTVCTNGNAVLTASAISGGIRWYDSASGGTLLHTGDTVNIANVINDTSLYAEAYTGISDSLLANVGGTGGNEGAVFEIVPKQNITLTDVTWTAGSTGLYDIRVYIKTGGYTTDMTNAAAWTLIGSDPAFTGSSGVAYKLNLSSPHILQQGQTYSIYVVNADAALRNVRYQSTGGGTMGNIYSEDNALQIKVGSRIAVNSADPFDNGVSNNYAFTGTLWYELLNCTSARTQVNAIIKSPVNITTHPVATRTICAGGNTTYTVAATGSYLNYQWQVYNGTTWSNATGGVYSGGNTNTLTITAATAAQDGYLYRCLVDVGCVPDTSNTGSLTVETAPAITTDPITHTICTGSNTTFTVAATGSNLSYQWQVYNGTAWNNATGGIYSGGSTNTLTLTNATTVVDNYQYRCVVSNTACTAATSAAATLTINVPANITTQPVATRTICVGANTTYTVAATGSNLNYQWEMYDGTTWNNVNGPVYSGANTNTLTITAATAAQDGQYRCTISNTSCAPVASNTADLTVNTPPAITTDPQTSRIICAGATTSFNIVATGTNLVYNWETNNGTSTWSTVNGTMYSGVNTNILSITGPTFGMNGYLYRCVVTNTGCALKVSKIGTLTVQEPPAVTTQPQATRTICAGNNTTFSIAATGTSISYQWEVFNGTTWSNANGGLYTGSNTNTLTIANATAAENGYQYRCAISSPTCATLNSNPGTLTVETAPAITTDPVSRIVCEGGSTTFNVVATGTNLTYQWERSGNGTVWLPLTNGTEHTGVNTTTLSLPNVTGGLVYKYYRCVVSGSCPPAIVSNPAELEIRIAPSITNQPQNVEACVGKPVRFTILASGSQLTYRWQISTNGGTNWNFLSEAGIYSGTNTPILNISTVALSANNYKYKCIVSGYCPSPVTTNIATLTVNTYVAVTSQPIKADTICSGGNINLSVGATGSGLTYEWYLNKGNGDPIEKLADNTIYGGTNTANLTGTGIVVTEKTHTYTYSCLVIGTCSTVRTDLSKITIYAPPAVRQQPLSVDKCDKTRRTQFSIKADGTAITYQWQESADGGNTWNPLANGVNYNYVNTNTLEIFEVDLSMHNYQYRCVVTGICGTPAASNAARLVVTPLLEPQVTITASSNDICAGTSVTFTPTPTAGGSSPTYQWRVNSTNVATGATYTTSLLANNDFVSCIMTSNAVCKTKTTASSNYEYVKVTPRTNASVSITSNVGTSWCSGKDAIFTATPVNGGNAPAFEWTVNGASTGVTTQQFTTMLNNGDEVQCLMTSSIKCATPAVAASNKIKMIINPTTSASVLISPNPDSVICSEDEVLMYVAFTNGGSLPKFQWMLNGVDMPGETNATLKTTKIKQDDMVNCRLISSNTCVFPEVSNGISFDVNSRLKPEVRLQSSFMGNNTYTFTASAVNEGANPSYVWFRNGTLQSTLTGPVQTFEDLSTVERIHVQLVSSEACIIKGLEVVSSNVITTTSVATTEKLFNSITLHPNPGTGAFTINGTLNTKILNKEVLIKITNSVGQTVYQQQHYIKDNNIHLPISLGSHLVGGIYMVTLIADNDMFSMKYILSR